MQDFKQLIGNITATHSLLQRQAANSVNQALTIRNWLIGLYIVEFEQDGEDRAQYGSKLLARLGSEFVNIKGLNERAFRSFRQFYRLYPQIAPVLAGLEIWGSLTTISGDDSKSEFLKKVISQKAIRGSLTTELNNSPKVNGKLIITKLSYTHIEQLIRIDDDLKRTFYEIECIKGTWSIRELKRQVSTLYFERSGLSAKPEKLSALVQQKTQPQEATDIIKNIYAFEFLDLKTKDVVEESDLETALIESPTGIYN
jgi:hypothetical protein